MKTINLTLFVALSITGCSKASDGYFLLNLEETTTTIPQLQEKYQSKVVDIDFGNHSCFMHQKDFDQLKTKPVSMAKNVVWTSLWAGKNNYLALGYGSEQKQLYLYRQGKVFEYDDITWEEKKRKKFNKCRGEQSIINSWREPIISYYYSVRNS